MYGKIGTMKIGGDTKDIMLIVHSNMKWTYKIILPCSKDIYDALLGKCVKCQLLIHHTNIT